MQFDRLFDTKILQLSGNCGAHSFDRTGRAHRLTITLLAKANRIARGMPHTRHRTCSKSRNANWTSAAFLFGTFQPLHQYFLDRSPQATQTNQATGFVRNRMRSSCLGEPSGFLQTQLPDTQLPDTQLPDAQFGS